VARGGTGRDKLINAASTDNSLLKDLYSQGQSDMAYMPTIGTNYMRGSATDGTGYITKANLKTALGVPTVLDASPSQKGIVQLAGDLGGSATTPQVVKASAKFSVHGAGFPGNIQNDLFGLSINVNYSGQGYPTISFHHANRTARAFWLNTEDGCFYVSDLYSSSENRKKIPYANGAATQLMRGDGGFSAAHTNNTIPAYANGAWTTLSFWT
jgi:hypothetical protein